jgi:hypothetical protein
MEHGFGSHPEWVGLSLSVALLSVGIDVGKIIKLPGYLFVFCFCGF